MDGTFKEKEVEKIKQSVRKKNRDWTLIKRIIKQYNKPIIVSDLGCGTGATAILSKTLPNIKQYNAIDGSKEILKFVEIEKIPYVKIYHLDLECAKLPKSDIFISKYLFHHIKNKERLIKEIYSKLSEDGKLIIIDKFPRWSFSVIIEKIFHFVGIKKILGKHYYSTDKDFENITKIFYLEESKIKKGKTIKNFFTKTNYYVFSK